ncbi:MAG: hypothetical protein ACE5DZ_01755 [Mariprofundus sp.]
MTRVLFSLLMLWIAAMPLQVAAAPVSGDTASQSAEAVMQQFAGDDEVSPQRKIETERKHQILFLMGVSLLILLLVTGSLGIAMVAFGKDVFLPHMIFAGLSLTLAAVHSATAIAWFWPW